MILGVIPARGGSRRVKRKNIRPLCGKPLIAWTIEAAKESKLLDRCVVSTEDPEISSIAENFKAEILPRPAALASDESLIVDALQDILKTIKADIMVLLQPTSPMRNKGLIDLCIKRFIKNNADCLATGFQCKFREYGDSTPGFKGFFYDDGNVYVIKTDLIRQGKLFGGKVERVEITREENIEIDDEFDLWMAEQVLSRRIKEKRQ